MPIFDFKCKCGHVEEKLIPRDGPVPEHCDTPMEKLISSPSRFIFKGSGFYATDHGKQGYGLNKAERKVRVNRELKERGMAAI